MLVDIPLLHGGQYQMMLRLRFFDGLFSLMLLSYLTLSLTPAVSSAALYIGAALEKSS